MSTHAETASVDRLVSVAARSLAEYASPLAMLRNLYVHRDLVWLFAVRDVQGRYRGAYLGLLWSVLTPLLMLVVYTFVFGVVLRTRWEGQAHEGSVEFSLILFAGLIVFGVFSECLGKAPGLIVGYPNYVKKVVFPLEVLPVALLVSSLIHAGINLLVLFAGSLMFLGHISITAVYFPLVLLGLGMLTLGLTWFLASLGVFVRDVGPTISILLTVLMFLSAVFYPASAFPENFRWTATVNPIALIVEDARRTLIFGQPPHWVRLPIVIVASATIMQLGYVWFMRTKRWFSDVI